MKNKKISFERPNAAPIFRPTIKEFKDPLEYIEKIRPIAQSFGICKIVTPKQWNPPFAIDRYSFKFRPRVQRLNEVGAHARIRNNFYRCLEAFCVHQNINYEHPIVKNEKVDVFELHKIVQSYGGSYQVTRKKQWTQICRELGYGDKAKKYVSSIHNFFNNVIQPYLNFCDTMYQDDNPKLFSITPISTKDKTGIVVEQPKMTRAKVRSAKKNVTDQCFKCKKFDGKKWLICSDCELRYHESCVEDLNVKDIESHEWICQRCCQINCQRELARLDAEVFGFSQSTCKYSLDSFSNYADNFKQTYFGNRKNVSLREVEEEYWRLVAAEDSADDVVVKYGADISSSLTSSGFPTSKNRHLYNERDQQYADSGWNLNNLPCLNKSIFQFISHDISGMTVPWCYVGMVFSCFCWHIEDHWSYSINYMHTGECKTWYGIPESDADKFENLMQQEAKQLFDRSPDLLHHITTQMNPTFLMKNDIKVFRTDQAAGEFVVTFPRAYHAGFNQGFNFAEAVNFCPADWLVKGRASVASYRQVKRPSVFSHSELIIKMSNKIELLDLGLLRALLDELICIQQDEKKFRRQLCEEMSSGPCRTERMRDINKEDDIERECLVCRTTLFISGAVCVECFKNTNRMTCLDHIKDICKCSTLDNVVLKYRFSLDELTNLVNGVRNRLQQMQLWMSRLYNLSRCEFCSTTTTSQESKVMHNIANYIETLNILSPEELSGNSNNSVEEKPNLEELRMLLQHGKSMNCPVYLLDFLEDIIETCQKAMNMTDELLKYASEDEQKKKEETDYLLEEEEEQQTEQSEADQEDEDIELNKENSSVAHEVRTLRNNKKIVKQEARLHNQKSQNLLKSTKLAAPHIEKSEKLTLPELRLLVDKLRSLPAHVPQLEQAAEILCSINEWRSQLYGALVSSSSLMDLDLLYKYLNEQKNNSIVYLPECSMLCRMLNYLSWVKEAKKLLSDTSSDLPTLEQFKKLLDQGQELLSMIEIDKIATMSEAIDINDDSEENSAESDQESRTIAWKLITEAMKSCEKQLQKIKTDGETMQNKAEEILNSKPGKFALFSLNSLLKGAKSDLKCRVNGIEDLDKVVSQAELINVEIQHVWNKIQAARQLVHIDDLLALLSRADSLCVQFERVNDLRALANTVETWRKHLKSMFVRSPPCSQLPTPSLLEILLPRPVRQFRLMISRETAISSRLVAAVRADECETKQTQPDENNSQQASSQHLTRSNRKSGSKRSSSTCIGSDDPLSVRLENVVAFENHIKSFLANSEASEIGNSFNTNSSVSTSVSSNPTSNLVNLSSNNHSSELDFVNEYKAMYAGELEWMWNLREMNEEKASKDSSGRDFYCVCRKRGTDNRGAQVMCDLCQDWLHLACLGLEPHRDLRRRKFLCPQCERSHRPAFELVLAERRKLDTEARHLLVPEHMALCLMCQRITNFHKHTNQLFSPHTELGAAFNEYKRLYGVQAILPRCQDQNMHDSYMGISAGGNMSHHELSNISSTSKQSRKTPHGAASKGANVTNMGSLVSNNSATGQVNVNLSNPNNTPGIFNSEYSSGGNNPTQTSTTNNQGLSAKEAKAGITKLRASLSDDARRELEEIYIELCLLEVNQPTVTWIWKLYHSLIVEDEDDDNVEEDEDNEEEEDDEEEEEQLSISKPNRNTRLSSSEDDLDNIKRHDLMKHYLTGQTAKRIHQTRGEASLKQEKFSFKRKLVANTTAQRLNPTGNASSSSKKPIKTPVVKKSSAVSTGLTKKKPPGASTNTKQSSKARALEMMQYDYDDETGYGCDDDDEEEEVILLDKALHKRKINQRSTTTSLSNKKPKITSANICNVKSKSAASASATQKNFEKNIDSEDEYMASCSPAGSKRTSTSGTNIKRRHKYSGDGRSSNGSHPGGGVSHKSKKSQSHRTAIINEKCAAKPCKGYNIDWVACDKCDLWYHWHCVGIQHGQQLQKRFLCPACKDHPKTTKRSANKHSLQTDSSVIDDSVVYTKRKRTTSSNSNVAFEETVVNEAGISSSSSHGHHHSNHRNNQQTRLIKQEQLHISVDDDDDDDADVDHDVVDDQDDDDDQDDLNVAIDDDEVEDDNDEDDEDDDEDNDDNLGEHSNKKPQLQIKGELCSNNNKKPSLKSSELISTTKLETTVTSSYTAQQNLSPPPPFLQSECCVHEEEVEISYASKSDSDV